jgi:hypothetical protein
LFFLLLILTFLSFIFGPFIISNLLSWICLEFLITFIIVCLNNTASKNGTATHALPHPFSFVRFRLWYCIAFSCFLGRCLSQTPRH